MIPMSFLRARQSDADRIRAEIRADNLRLLRVNGHWHRPAGLSDTARNQYLSHRLREERY